MLLGAAALVVLPAAIAWACVPASSIGFDKSGYKYKAGDTVTVTGRGFSNNAPVVMKLQAPSGAQKTVGTTGKTTDNTGGFTDTFALDSDAAPGDYVVSVTVGNGGARETLTVEPPESTVPVGGGGGGTPSGPTGPPVTTPIDDIDDNDDNTTAARRKAIARCNKKFRRKTARGASKRKLARKRAACVRRAKKRYP